MTGCTKIFVQPVVVTGKNCSENTMKKMPKMLKGCSSKKPAVLSDEKLFWATKQGNHSMLLCAVKTAMHCGKCD
jgi:hypothetical protein